MIKDSQFFNPAQKSSFAAKTTHYNQSMRKHFMDDLLNPEYVLDDSDHRYKFFLMNSYVFLIQKHNDFQRHIDRFNEFCERNDVGALFDADSLVQVNALLNQVKGEIIETRADLKDIVSTTYASQKWLKELDYIDEQLPLI